MPDSVAAPVVIQPATVADIPVIIELAEATWEPTYRFIISQEQIEYMYRVIYTPASLARQMEQDGHRFLVVQYDGYPAGYASFSERDAEPGVFKLHKLYVLPSHQGLGLGQRLVEAVEGGARMAGGQWLELNVNRHNPALNFYHRLGFQQYREEDIPIGPYWMNDYVLRKRLNG